MTGQEDSPLTNSAHPRDNHPPLWHVPNSPFKSIPLVSDLWFQLEKLSRVSTWGWLSCSLLLCNWSLFQFGQPTYKASIVCSWWSKCNGNHHEHSEQRAGWCVQLLAIEPLVAPMRHLGQGLCWGSFYKWFGNWYDPLVGSWRSSG